MVQLWRAIVAIVVILAYLQDAMAIDLDWVLGASEVLINEDDPLEIKCTGPKEIFFTFPSSQDDSKIVTSAYNTSKEYNNGYHSYIFRRDNTVYGDTGLYGCPDGFLELTSHPLFRTDHNLLYIYIQSNRSGFVEESNFYPMNAIAGGSAIISCRPTSPDIKVQLLFSDKIKEDVDFNPRIGFTLKNLTLKNSGPFQCVDQINDIIFEVDYMLTVLRKQKLNKPKILDHTLQYVTRGQILHVNCTTDVPVGTSYSFNWSTPQQSDRITTRQYQNTLGTMIRATSELIIRDVRYEDEGMYECSIMSMHDMQKTEKFIEVHDPNNRFMNLTAQDAARHYQSYEGDKVQWVVYVSAYPPPRIEWFNPKNEEINGPWNSTAKYNVKVTPTETILKINSLNIYDMGIYSLHVTNEDRMEMLNITLDVLVKPLLMLRMEEYYHFNKMAEISCDVAAFPVPDITWNFIGCPHFPSCRDAQTIELNDITQSGTTTSFRSTVKMTIKMSGYLTCSACNSRGCDSNNGTLLVTDGADGFGIIGLKDKVTEGDDVELICTAIIYNYTNKFEWYIDDSPVEEDDRLTFDIAVTPFTYRSILKIKNVTKADARTYTCVNKEAMDYPLTVYAAEKPYFINTNLYKNETTVDLNEDLGPIILKCFVGGMPKPKVTWYKDDKELKIQSKDQYMSIHDAQELRIKYLRETDSGKYSCHVHSRIGELEAYATITVKGKAIPIGLIILIAVLSITVVILVIYFSIKVRREKMIRRELMEAGLMHFEEGAVECLNPEMTVDDQAELLPYDKKFEFPRDKLKLGKQLGSGAFGVVMKAEAEGICESEPVTTVAVKMVRRTTDPTYVRALASELKIMVHLGKHLNVVNLLGACTKNISKRELLVIVEYCRFGNLHNYLLRHRSDFINQIDPTTRKFDPSIGYDLLNRSVSISSNNRIKYVALSFSRSMSYNSAGQNSPMDSQGVSMSPDAYTSASSAQPLWRSNYRGDYKDYNLKPICTQDLLSWAFQVARGMEYLSQRKVLHGDLAARNILLAEDNIVKICDFGLAKTMYKDDNYKKKGDGLLPIKWMAIESIRDRVFSTQSDIWSFGIVLWEFFTLAETPYPGMEAEKQYQKLIEGYRMEQPEYATSEVYNIMLQCWKAKPTLRPSFTELVQNIGDLLEESVKMHYISLNDPYIDMNTMMLENGRSDYLQMFSAPDHTALSSPTHEYSNLTTSKAPDSAYLPMSPSHQRDESGIFSPTSEGAHFDFPSPISDSEDALEASPMLNKQEEDDPYLKPINVQARRAEFVRQRQAMKNQAVDQPIDRDSGYCNTPRHLQLIELNEKKGNDANEKSDNGNTKDDFIIRTQDNYINMPKQKSDLILDVPDGFSNPSYLMMTNNDQKV